MAKRMQDKESIAGMSWLVLLIIACWGGLVRYLIDVKQSKATWSLINALAQMVVSGFTGVIAGLVSIESGLSIYMILATAGKWHESYDNETLGFFSLLSSALTGSLLVVGILANISNLVQLWLAPKIWLIEYTAELLKG